MLYKIIVLSLFLCSSAWATVPVERYPSGTPVQVCQPSDTNSNCGGGGSGTNYWTLLTGNQGIGTTNNVGIGSVNPQGSLDVGSGSICLGGVCQTGWPSTSQWTTAGNNIYYNTGNVGIGTTTPVGGLAVMNGNVGIGTWVPSALFQVGGTGNVGVGSNIPGDTLDVQGTIRFNGNLAGGIR